MPFICAEFHDYRKQQGLSTGLDDEFALYMNWGGFPLVFSETDDEQRQIMVEPIFDSIVLRDIVRRKHLKNAYSLEHVIDYVISSTTRSRL